MDGISIKYILGCDATPEYVYANNIRNTIRLSIGAPKYIYLENIQTTKCDNKMPDVIFHTKNMKQLRVPNGISLMCSYDKRFEYMWNYKYSGTKIKNDDNLFKNIYEITERNRDKIFDFIVIEPKNKHTLLCNYNYLLNKNKNNMIFHQVIPHKLKWLSHYN